MSQCMNAYEELISVLAENRKSVIQIERVFNKEGAIDINWFLMICEGAFYTNPSPYGTLDPYLIVAGRDFWLTREMAMSKIDADYWCFHKIPEPPQEYVKAFSLFKPYPKEIAPVIKQDKIYDPGESDSDE